jgi:hypothetical protein
VAAAIKVLAAPRERRAIFIGRVKFRSGVATAYAGHKTHISRWMAVATTNHTTSATIKAPIPFKMDIANLLLRANLTVPAWREEYSIIETIVSTIVANSLLFG